jgi:ribosome-interacting GTPase 1
MSEYKIVSADIAFRCDATIDDLIDVIEERSRRYIPVIYALNKIDAITIEELDLLYRIPHSVPISSEKVLSSGDSLLPLPTADSTTGMERR